MHSQGIDGRWEEGFTFFTLDYGSPKQIVCYSTRNSSIWWVCVLKSLFDLENRSYLLWRSTGCIAKLLTNIHKKNWNFDIGIQITKKIVFYSTRRSSQLGKCAFRGSFDLENCSNWTSWITRCIVWSWPMSTKHFGISDDGIRITNKKCVIEHAKIVEMGVMRALGFVWPLI